MICSNAAPSRVSMSARTWSSRISRWSPRDLAGRVAVSDMPGPAAPRSPVTRSSGSGAASTAIIAPVPGLQRIARIERDRLGQIDQHGPARGQRQTLAAQETTLVIQHHPVCRLPLPVAGTVKPPCGDVVGHVSWSSAGKTGRGTRYGGCPHAQCPSAPAPPPTVRRGARRGPAAAPPQIGPPDDEPGFAAPAVEMRPEARGMIGIGRSHHRGTPRVTVPGWGPPLGHKASHGDAAGQKGSVTPGLTTQMKTAPCAYFSGRPAPSAGRRGKWRGQQAGRGRRPGNRRQRRDGHQASTERGPIRPRRTPDTA